LHFFAVFIFSIGIAWLATREVVVPEKNEQIATKQGIIDMNQRQNEWNNRFIPRINVVLAQLDELGQHSEKLEQKQNRHDFRMIFHP
jgi:hypothetical protein